MSPPPPHLGISFRPNFAIFDTESFASVMLICHDYNNSHLNSVPTLTRAFGSAPELRRIFAGAARSWDIVIIINIITFEASQSSSSSLSQSGGNLTCSNPEVFSQLYQLFGSLCCHLTSASLPSSTSTSSPSSSSTTSSSSPISSSSRLQTWATGACVYSSACRLAISRFSCKHHKFSF